MHKSWFTYNVSRHWPYRWYTPVVLIGGLLFLALFSSLNLVSSGYTLAVQYTTQPNTTAGEVWFNKWPSFLTSKVKPTCQAVTFPVGTKLQTNNTALTYTLTLVKQVTKDGDDVNVPYLVYRNSILSGCDISSLQIHIQGRDRTATQIAMSTWGMAAQAYIQCSLTSDVGIVTLFNLTADYQFIPETVSVYDGKTEFTGRNKTSRASLYWGESLLAYYYMKVTDDFGNSAAGGGFEQGVVTFTPNKTAGPDLENPNYFSPLWRFIINTASSPNVTSWQVYWDPDARSIENLTTNNIIPNIWGSATSFIKSLHSTVLADLGQTTPGQANILTNTTLLQYYTATFNNDINIAALAQNPYNVLKDLTGPLGINPAVLAATYLCQTPRLKPKGDLFVAILIADLVLMQAIYQLFNLIANSILIRHPEANMCEGCLKPTALETNDSHVTKGESHVQHVEHVDGANESYLLIPRSTLHTDNMVDDYRYNNHDRSYFADQFGRTVSRKPVPITTNHGYSILRR